MLINTDLYPGNLADVLCARILPTQLARNLGALKDVANEEIFKHPDRGLDTTQGLQADSWSCSLVGVQRIGEPIIYETVLFKQAAFQAVHH
jgi:hypothetical protein